MGYRRLGRTGLRVSEIVLGSHFGDPLVGPSWSQVATGDAPGEVAKNRTEIVSRCLDHGINCADVTCGRDALALGAALKGRRDKMYIAADDAEYAMRQNLHRNTEGQMQSIESCLRKLGTDYLDVWRPQFKPLGGHRDVDLEMCVAVFEKARRQGKVRFLGMSTEDWSWMQHMIEGFPQYMVVYAPCPLPSRTVSPDSETSPAGAQQAFFAAARAKDIGVILTCPPDETDRQGKGAAVARILGNLQISAVAVDVNLPNDVDDLVRALSERQVGT
jgi:aryl-alcohol dehydrogenase-like predicted oxidoreductase